jgi:hypothetical protein
MPTIAPSEPPQLRFSLRWKSFLLQLKLATLLLSTAVGARRMPARVA